MFSCWRFSYPIKRIFCSTHLYPSLPVNEERVNVWPDGWFARCTLHGSTVSAVVSSALYGPETCSPPRLNHETSSSISSPISTSPYPFLLLQPGGTRTSGGGGEFASRSPPNYSAGVILNPPRCPHRGIKWRKSVFTRHWQDMSVDQLSGVSVGYFVETRQPLGINFLSV